MPGLLTPVGAPLIFCAKTKRRDPTATDTIISSAGKAKENL